MTHARRRTGFTLIEVMTALTIMSLVMVALYTALNITLETRDQLENESKVSRLGPGLLDIIEQDLRRIWIMDIKDDRVFKGESHSIDGESADSLSFLTTVDSVVTRRIHEREVASDVCETGYRLRRNPAIPDLLELWRRQSFHVDGDPLKDGVYELLYDRVVSLQVRYRDEIDRYAEKFSEWDAAEQHRLPALVEIELAIEAVPRTADDLGRKDAASRTLRYRRVIALPRDSDIRMRVHPLPPVFAGAGNSQDVGGANPDDGTGNAPNGAPPDGTPGGPPGAPPGGDPGGGFQEFIDGLTQGG
jgi:prepilin-type N-terminal cleavage/methylation domain-containing protein